MGNGLHLFVRHEDKEGNKHLICDDLANGFVDRHFGYSFNDQAFLDPDYDGDLYIDQVGDELKYAFVYHEQIMDSQQYTDAVMRDGAVSTDAVSRKTMAENIAYLDENATLMTFDEVRDYINHDYIHNQRRGLEAHQERVAKFGGDEAKFRVEMLAASPAGGSPEDTSFLMTNGEWASSIISTLRSPLQNYFAPNSPAYTDPMKAFTQFMQEGNIHWEPSDKTFLLAHNTALTPEQYKALSDMLDNMTQEEREQVQLFACNTETAMVSPLTEENARSFGLEEAYNDCFGLLDPDLRTQKNQDIDDRER